MISDGACKAVDGLGADRSGAAVSCGRVGASMNHGLTDFDACGIAVEDQSANLGFEDVYEITVRYQVGFRAMHGPGEMAFKALREVEQLSF